MKNTKTALLIILILFIAVLPIASVELIIDESLENESRVIEDDYIFIGDTLGFNGAADTLYFIGRNLTLSEGNLRSIAAMGETLDVEGRVEEDAAFAARTINITADLNSTTFAAGENVNFFPQAELSGTLFAAGSRVNIAGNIDGDLYAGARILIISGRINGDVHAGTAQIRIENGGEVTGDLIYESETRISDETAEAVGGEITFNEYEHEADWQKLGWFFRVAKWVISVILLVSAFVFALLYYLFPGLRNTDTKRDHRRFWITTAWGLIPFFLFPILTAALFMAGFLFGITVPIAVSLLFSLGAIGYILTALALPQIGSYVSLLFNWQLSKTEGAGVYSKLVLGFGIYFILSLIPFLNILVFILTTSLGWGVAIEKLLGIRFKNA
ncbi:MAG: hypothetical protein ACLFR1_14310 [Spirochaetia bacterium]